MENTIYLRLRHRIQVKPRQTVYLKDMAQIIANEVCLEKLKEIPIYTVKDKDRNITIIDVMKVISKVSKVFKEEDIQTIGPVQTIVEIIYKKKKVSVSIFLVIWLLLFIGAGLTIMNFHEDVSMQQVHQKLYEMITGEKIQKPLIFQIPYSIGLGLGMILFFNHIFRKRLNEEPSPLEVEMFNYQQNLDQYVIMHENKESIKHLDDH